MNCPAHPLWNGQRRRTDRSALPLKDKTIHRFLRGLLRTTQLCFSPVLFLRIWILPAFVLGLLALKEQDRSTGLEAHLVSANSRYIQEQQEQQQVKEEAEWR